MISSSVTLVFDNEIMKLVKDYGELEDLVDQRFQGIEMLEVALTKERTKKMHAQKALEEANKKLEEIAVQ